jgi:hypothetical protein
MATTRHKITFESARGKKYGFPAGETAPETKQVP